MNTTEVTKAINAVVYRGFLIPEWYHDEQPDAFGLRVVYLVSGITMPLAVVTFSKALRHSLESYTQRKLLNAYIIMVWSVWTTSVGIGIISFLFLQGIIPASFLMLWLVQMQCILQIVAGRLAVLLPERRDHRNLKLGLFVVVLLLTVSVACTWLPARLQLSPRFVRANNVWDRVSKALFLAVDLSLNVFFLQTVHRRLISAGLAQYRVLFRVNVVMICFGVVIDASFIGVMSYHTPVTYIQFNPLVLLAKLYIELNLAELISRVVQSTPPPPPPPATMPGPEVVWGSKLETCIEGGQGGHRMGKSIERRRGGGGGTAASLDPPKSGIMKTVELQVMIQRRTSEMLVDAGGYESDK